MYRLRVVSLFGALLLAAFGIASAQNAYTARPMNVRAGPNREYPLVAQLGPGAPLNVNGCLSGYSWCDVSFDGNRGWMYASGISFVYNGGRVPLYSYGAQLGLPILTFSLGAYWDRYYRGRPWYSQRSTWIHRRLPPPRGPVGRPHAAPRPMPNARPPANGRPGARGEMRGHAAPQGGHPAPQARRGQPQREHAPQAKKPPSSSRGGSDRGDQDRQHSPP